MFSSTIRLIETKKEHNPTQHTQHPQHPTHTTYTTHTTHTTPNTHPTQHTTHTQHTPNTQTYRFLFYFIINYWTRWIPILVSVGDFP